MNTDHSTHSLILQHRHRFGHCGHHSLWSSISQPCLRAPIINWLGSTVQSPINPPPLKQTQTNITIQTEQQQQTPWLWLVKTIPDDGYALEAISAKADPDVRFVWNNRHRKMFFPTKTIPNFSALGWQLSINSEFQEIWRPWRKYVLKDHWTLKVVLRCVCATNKTFIIYPVKK